MADVDETKHLKPDQLQEAAKLIRQLVQAWYCEDTSPSDLLDEIAQDAVSAGIATELEVNAWGEEAEEEESDA